jgi:hypothetical protein
MATATVTTTTLDQEFNEPPKMTIHAAPPVQVHDTPILNVLDESVHYGDFRDGKLLILSTSSQSQCSSFSQTLPVMVTV